LRSDEALAVGGETGIIVIELSGFQVWFTIGSNLFYNDEIRKHLC
jgi:hypothetical protein